MSTLDDKLTEYEAQQAVVAAAVAGSTTLPPTSPTELVQALQGVVNAHKKDPITIGDGTSYAAVAVNLVRTTIDRHAFEDWSTLNTTDTALGYASFDAKATMNNASAQNHFVGYQSRNIYSGAGNLTSYWHGYDTEMVHNGTGTVAFAAGIRLRDVGGTGPITNNYGLYIDAFSRGANRDAIHSEDGNTHYLGGPTGSVKTGTIQAAGLNFGVDTLNKTIAYGFGTAGQVNYGYHDFYNGKNSVVVRFHYAGVVMAAAFSFLTDAPSKELSYGYGTSGTVNYGEHAFYDGKTTEVLRLSRLRATASVPVKLPGYTVANLPAGANGDTAYCTNGRKVGEGAGAGTGVPVYYSGSAWRRYSDDTIVVA